MPELPSRSGAEVLRRVPWRFGFGALLVMRVLNPSLLYSCPKCGDCAVSKDGLSLRRLRYWESRCRSCGAVVRAEPKWIPDGILWHIATASVGGGLLGLVVWLCHAKGGVNPSCVMIAWIAAMPIWLSWCGLVTGVWLHRMPLKIVR